MTSRWILIFACWWTAVGGALATDFQLVVRHTLDGHPIVLGKVVNGVAISRVDWLISELALQDEDGDCLQSIDWFEFFSQEERRVHGTLEEVVEHYNSGIHRSDTLDPNIAKHPVEGLGLSEADKAALVAFLKSLTDEGFGQ